MGKGLMREAGAWGQLFLGPGFRLWPWPGLFQEGLQRPLVTRACGEGSRGYQTSRAWTRSQRKPAPPSTLHPSPRLGQFECSSVFRLCSAHRVSHIKRLLLLHAPPHRGLVLANIAPGRFPFMSSRNFVKQCSSRLADQNKAPSSQELSAGYLSFAAPQKQ